MRDKGYFGIGIEHAKTEFNYWTLFRTAQIFDADFLFVINKRFKKNCADTMCSYRHLPIFSYKDIDDFNNHRPYDCRLIGIELLESAHNLSNFIHPKRAVYLLGAEDHGLTAKAISLCNAIIKLPGEHSLNVSVAGSIVIYDRIAKRNA
jgi:tRNA G18 (ribose-2'-O)-methylase SpoU